MFTHLQGISVSSFYSSKRMEVISVVWPDGGSSDSEEGTSDEDIEDELNTEGQDEDSSNSSDRDSNGSSIDEAGEEVTE